MTTETIDNSGIAEMIAEITQNDQNMNGAPLAIGVNVGLAIPAALVAPVPKNIPVSHLRNQNGSMEPILRDDNKRCYSI